MVENPDAKYDIIYETLSKASSLFQTLSVSQKTDYFKDPDAFVKTFAATLKAELETLVIHGEWDEEKK